MSTDTIPEPDPNPTAGGTQRTNDQPTIIPTSTEKPTAAVETAKARVEKMKKKPENKGDFHGEREIFLRSKMDDYWAASKKGKTRRFWPILFKEYWDRFDWRLALNEEPSPDRVFDPAAKLTKEQEDAKSKIEMATKTKLKTWFNHQRTAMGLNRNPFTPYLSRLRRPDDKAPKRITDYQFYMQHDDYKAAVNAEFDEKYWDTPRHERLARRCDIARARFAAEPYPVKERIRKEALEEHEDELKRWEEADEGLPSVAPEDQDEARARFTGVVEPMIQALRAYTGWHITMIAGRIVDGKVEMKSVHAGKMKPDGEEGGLDFTDWDPKGYKTHFLDQFWRFLVAANRDGGSGSAPAPIEREASSTSTFDTTPPPTTTTPTAPVPPAPGAPGAPASTNPAPTPTGNGESDIRPLDDDDDPPPALLEEEDPLTRRMRALKILEPDLRAEVTALSVEEREARVAALERMGDLELRRVNNTAKRVAELARLKNVPVPEIPDAAPKRKRAGKGAKKPRKRGAKGRRGTEDDEDSASSSSEEESDAGDDDVGAREQPPQTRARGRGSATTSTVTSASTASTVAAAPTTNDAEGATPRSGAAAKAPSKAPKWAKDAQKTLLSGELGENASWKQATRVWWAVEEASRFESPVKGLGTEGRPKEVHVWIKNARKKRPDIKNVEAFVGEIQEWWKRLNPAWRINNGELIQEVQGSLDVLRVPGANGFFTVLVLLKWWWEEQGPTDAWVAAFQDVTWVLNALLGRRLEEEPETTDTSSVGANGAGSTVGNVADAPDGSASIGEIA